jgi:hypothetical protein
VPLAENLARLEGEIHKRADELAGKIQNPQPGFPSLAKYYDGLCGMIEAHLIVSGAWRSQLDPREYVTEHARQVLGIDLPALAG